MVTEFLNEEVFCIVRVLGAYESGERVNVDNNFHYLYDMMSMLMSLRWLSSLRSPLL